MGTGEQGTGDRHGLCVLWAVGLSSAPCAPAVDRVSPEVMALFLRTLVFTNDTESSPSLQSVMESQGAVPTACVTMTLW